MEPENDKPRKRVSFAPETQINYIYQDESTATKTSSFFSDTPMDITTELEELKNLNLFSNEEKTEIPSEIRKLSLAPGNIRKTSLNPHELTFFNYRNSKSGNGDISDNSTDDLSEQLNVSNKPTSLFWNASIAKKQSIDGSFENHGTINSSFGVDELVNTIDLKKIIPQTVNEIPSITEFLSSQGIRFLDETAVDGMKRDTLSKSRNVIDPSLVVYYQFSLKERIDFLFNFSNFLIDKMKDLEMEIETLKNTIDIKAINKDNLKRIRNDSRNKSKIDWYSLRKIYEIQFNKKILENRNKVIEMAEKLKMENRKVEDTIALKNKAVNLIKEQIAELKQTVSLTDKASIQKTEVFREMIKERKNVLISIKSEVETIQGVIEEQSNEEKAIQKRISKLQTEIGNLKKNLSVKNVGENQLDEIKRNVKRYLTMYNFQLLKITNHSIIFELLTIKISVDYNSTLETTKYAILNVPNDPFSEFVCAFVSGFIGSNLCDFIKKCIEVIVYVEALKKEIVFIKEKTRIECSYMNTCLYLRIFTSIGNGFFDVSLNKYFDLVFNGDLIENIKKCPGVFSSFIESKLIN